MVIKPFSLIAHPRPGNAWNLCRYGVKFAAPLRQSYRIIAQESWTGFRFCASALIVTVSLVPRHDPSAPRPRRAPREP